MKRHEKIEELHAKIDAMETMLHELDHRDDSLVDFDTYRRRDDGSLPSEYNAREMSDASIVRWPSSSADLIGQERLPVIALNPEHLAAKRIRTKLAGVAATRPYDVLRTEVLRAMTTKGWKTLGITSPTRKCGKTVTAINLAFSIARQNNQPVVLADLNLQQPQVANYLGLDYQKDGMLALLKRKTRLLYMAVLARSERQKVVVVPTKASLDSSELMDSRGMTEFLDELATQFPSHLAIFDLPPVLGSGDVVGILPNLDCVLLVASVGRSKISDLEESMKYLPANKIIKVVVNRAAGR